MDNYTFEDMWLDLKMGIKYIIHMYVIDMYYLELLKIAILKNY